MKYHLRELLICVTSFLIISGCNGTDSASSAGTSSSSLTGTAGTGSPVVSGTVTVTDSAMPANTLTGTTNASGVYSINNVTNLTFPVRITVSFAEGGAIRSLRSIAPSLSANGPTRANVTPITEVIAASVENITGVATLNAEISRLSGVLATALSNYGVAGNTDFIGGAYTADPTDPIDNALDLVSVQIDEAGNNIVLQSTADPSISTPIPVVGSQSQNVTPLPTPAPTASASPVDIKTLVDALKVALELGENLTSENLNNVFYEDYQDDQGLNKSSFAEQLSDEARAQGEIFRVVGYRILRCFADTGSVSDKCYIRVNLRAPLLAGDDFGATQGATSSADFFDLIAERRAESGSPGPMKFSGGYFKPYAASIKLFNRNIVTVNDNGIATENMSVEKALLAFRIDDLQTDSRTDVIFR